MIEAALIALGIPAPLVMALSWVTSSTLFLTTMAAMASWSAAKWFACRLVPRTIGALHRRWQTRASNVARCARRMSDQKLTPKQRAAAATIVRRSQSKI